MVRFCLIPLVPLILCLGLANPVAAVADGDATYDQLTDRFTQAELDAMLAPVALYPDALLLQVLVAATHPVDVVRAARWLRDQSEATTEQQILDVGSQQRWDASVMALVAFPDVLEQLDQALDWTQDLGVAFMHQEAEVLDTVQGLRQQAVASGHLTSTEQVRVVHEVVREVETIAIKPVRREVVVVPVYDTRVVYGGWRWTHHPPVWWSPPPRYRSHFVGVHWSSHYHYRPVSWWSGHVVWPQRTVVINNHHHHHYGATRHRPRATHHRPIRHHSHRDAVAQPPRQHTAPRQATPRQAAPRQAAPREMHSRAVRRDHSLREQ